MTRNVIAVVESAHCNHGYRFVSPVVPEFMNYILHTYLLHSGLGTDYYAP